ncbi:MULTISPECIES: rhodanese-like domain-containing protein [Francisella]|uniref:Rhodanese-like domain-containing protein n=1 Tax=Francisella adeliensis TaxID=2007306 RepID=A0A2Z4XW48_9GAMM|nr:MULTISPECIES: rhodanese-like domain-containing protein [Francisella]AXA33071.1 sulfurtransferase [Francisella adeliensis]MBK2086038.1 rhodanese-like domain-containing protein [Francisella adeliensis]MBK2096798.1 rhodanese-like domain-containing protein [Francisella adeliensis]QIW11300.1 rhodanese-like domain-containing protein [Francisella adeliensis]QIW13175.1 rhodanese-like domain-containing protein [Francisella adeliensis]
MENIGTFVSQNLLFCLSFILILAIYIIFELTQTKKSQYNLSVADAVLVVNRNKGIYLDTRDQESFINAHIIGAHNITANELSEKHKKLAKYKAKPIVIYGNQPEKSMLVLRKEGFEQVYTLKGGLSAWLQASYPVKSLSK